MKTYHIAPLKFIRHQEGGIAQAQGSDCVYYVSKDDAGFWWSVDAIVSLGATEADCVAAANEHHHARVATQFLTEVSP